MTKKIILEKNIAESEMSELAEQIADFVYPQLIIELIGPLGAGKTTLVRELCNKLGAREDVTSPTFTYVNLYTTKDGLTIYHFDLYRITSVHDFIDAGFTEMLHQSQSICIIEWPEIIRHLLTPPLCTIELSYGSSIHYRFVHVSIEE